VVSFLEKKTKKQQDEKLKKKEGKEMVWPKFFRAVTQKNQTEKRYWGTGLLKKRLKM